MQRLCIWGWGLLLLLTTTPAHAEAFRQAPKAMSALRQGATLERSNPRQAIAHYCSAARLGNPEAYFRIGRLLARGPQGIRNAPRANAHLALGMRAHNRALALAARDQVPGRQLVDGLAHRALAHAKACGQLDLARNGLAGLPLAMLQAVQYQPLDLLVQRAEGRRDRCRAATCGGRAFGAGRKQGRHGGAGCACGRHGGNFQIHSPLSE